jgi:serralysin
MAVDIAALQELYGANTTHARGNDVYTLPTANRSGTFYESLWDTGGTDTIRAGSTTRASTIDLNDATLRADAGGGGLISYVEGIHGGFTVAKGVVIENATGADGCDLITGRGEQRPQRRWRQRSPNWHRRRGPPAWR